ncbi:MAG: hypothetical protein R3230_01770 [Nitrosopumilaceae archaeon]|nr:hypothetical protein [Nitrosopumilaceae archaeon]
MNYKYCKKEPENTTEKKDNKYDLTKGVKLTKKNQITKKETM